MCVFQGNFPLSGMTVNSVEDEDKHSHVFEIAGKSESCNHINREGVKNSSGKTAGVESARCVQVKAGRASPCFWLIAPTGVLPVKPLLVIHLWVKCTTIIATPPSVDLYSPGWYYACLFSTVVFRSLLIMISCIVCLCWLALTTSVNKNMREPTENLQYFEIL